MKIQVRYFAALRDQRGVPEETIDTLCGTPGELYSELQAKYRLDLDSRLVRFAVNGAYVDSDVNLMDGDEVVVVPPVAGG